MKILKAIGAAVLAVATCFSARAEETLVKTPLILDGVEAGYTVTGLPNDEVAVVFTNHVAEAMTWTAPADLYNVQFLVVGGGGGGGAGTQGPGGGGGGVVTGKVHFLSTGLDVNTKVGEGGLYGTENPNSSKATGYNGENSYFSITNITYVTAYGGGAGRGGSANGGAGGSGGGGRPKKTGGTATKGKINDDILDCIYDWEYFGCNGGDGYNGNSAGGGGGALEAGKQPTGTSKGGAGGAGLPSDITGVFVTYGSGGGGSGSGGAAGGSSEAGSGGKSAKANAGGGGGGGYGYGGDGGKGGSGIVVLRYSIPAGTILVPELESKTYNGQAQTADVPESDGYTVTQTAQVNVGTYEITLTLNEGYKWGDNTTAPVTLEFEITQAANEWTVDPSITKDSWTAGVDEPGVLTPGETLFDNVSATITKNGGDPTVFTGTELPTESGDYVITYAVPTSDNYTNPEITSKSVAFSVLSGDSIPPYTITTGDLSIDNDLVLTIPYTLTCDATTTKTATLFALYAFDGAEATETNRVQLATGVALNGEGTATVQNMKPDAVHWVALYTQVDDEISPNTEFKSVLAPGPGEFLEATVTYTSDPKVYVVSGTIDPGLGEATVTVMWSLNSDECSNSSVAELSDDGTFTCTIPCDSLLDTLTYKVVVTNSITTDSYGTASWEDNSEVGTQKRADTANVTYTWTGSGGDNYWGNPENWSSSSNSCLGYPNSKYATAKFTTSDIEVNLDGRTMVLSDAFTSTTDTSTGFVFSKNLGEVIFRNGTISFQDELNSYGFGASGTTVVLDKVKLDNISFMTCPNSTVVFTGSYDLGFSFYPWEHLSGSTLIFRDGEMSCSFGGSWLKESYDIYVDNAKWTLTNAINDKSLASRVHFVDGEGKNARQAQIIVNGAMRLKNTYDICIPAGGHNDASIVLTTKYSQPESGCTFKLDVSDYKSGKPVPLVRYTSSTDQALSTDNLTLAAYEDGVNVTEKRNARLVWSGDDNTLYYKQDSQTGFSIIIR